MGQWKGNDMYEMDNLGTQRHKGRNEWERRTEVEVHRLLVEIVADTRVKKNECIRRKSATGFDLLGKNLRAVREGSRLEKRKMHSVRDETWWYDDGRKFRHPFLGALCDGTTHPTRSFGDGTSEQIRVRTTTESEKYNTKVCICFLTSHNVLFLSV